MAEQKTKVNAASVADFLGGVADEARRKDCLALLDLMKAATGYEPRMWGSSIVGFGRYKYRYESGREGESCVTGFSPRKGDLTIYLASGFEPFADLVGKLGKCKTGKGCLYIKKLGDVDPKVLKTLVSKSSKKTAETWPTDAG